MKTLFDVVDSWTEHCSESLRIEPHEEDTLASLSSFERIYFFLRLMGLGFYEAGFSMSLGIDGDHRLAQDYRQAAVEYLRLRRQACLQ